MSRGVNKVILIGNLGKTPEIRTFANGDSVANTSLATSESWTDKQTGERKEATEWHNLVFGGKLAEIAGKYLVKGSKIYVEGSLKTRKYEKDGAERYVTEIRVRDMQMLDGKPADGEQRPPAQKSAAPAQQPVAAGGDQRFEDDDIPF